LIFLPFYDFSTQDEGIYFRSTRGRWLTGIGVLLSLILTPLWIVLDEYFLNWSNWLPDWPSIITTGVIPVALILLGIVILSEVIHWIFEINTEERVMFLVTFFFTALIVLTLTGIFFRGPGMALYLPWNMPVVTGH
jgi:hypothetical protein